MDSALPILNILGLIALAFSIVYTQIRSGSRQVSSEVMSNYQTLDDQQKVIIQKQQTDSAGMQARLKSLENELAELRGSLKTKDEQIQEMNLRLRNMNPELLAILTEIRDFMSHLNEKLKGQDKQLLHQTEIMDKQVIREDNMDKASKSGTGKPTRIESIP